MRNIRCTLAVALCATILFVGPSLALSVGDRAPEIKVKDWLNTGKQSLAQLRGRIVVLEFWATWCPPCLASIPHLNKIHRTYKGEKIQLLSFARETRTFIQTFQQSRNLSIEYPIGADSSLFDTYGVSSIPYAFLIGRDGKVLWHGISNSKQMDEEIRSALRRYARRKGE